MSGRHAHIVGGTGQIGNWLRHFLEQNEYNVTVSNSQTEGTTDIEVADIIFFAVPISLAPSVIVKTSHIAKEHALLIDLSSIASPSIEALKATRHPALYIHFLFGPAVSDLQSQKIVFIPLHENEMITELKELFVKNGAEVLPMTADEHDFHMAHIQALTHFMNIAFADTLAANNIPFPPQTTTPVFLSQYAVAMRILTSNSAKLLAEIQIANPHFRSVLEGVIQRQSELLSLILGKQAEPLEQRYAHLNAKIAPHAEQKETVTKHSSSIPHSIDRDHLKIGYLGPEGTYTHQALLQLFQHKAPQASPYGSIYDVFNAVFTGEIEIGIVGAENSTEGTVRETFDYLLDFDLRVITSIDLPIHHSLLSKETDLKKITKVIAHPQALAQCRHWLRNNLPQAKTESAPSNLAGLKHIGEQGVAVIASASQAGQYGLHCLAENIEDNPKNVTKFYVISKRSDYSSSRKTLLFVTIFNRVGVLRDILNVFADFNISLDKIESRPSREKNWDYHFFIQVDIGPEEQRLEQSLNMLRQYCQKITIIGSF